jgi:hypothetical protein
MLLSAHGVSVTIPAGWEGEISRERGPQAMALADRGGQLRPVTHAATFALPAERGAFGSGAVEAMRDDDVFVALVEYDREAAGTALFARRGLPRRLDPRRFHPAALQRTLPGQAGHQEFFTDTGRAFCLYVVLGDADDAHLQVRRVEEVLAGIRIGAGP